MTSGSAARPKLQAKIEAGTPNGVPIVESGIEAKQGRARQTSERRDRLTATNCVHYRADRLNPIYVFLPMTCHLLGTHLRSELDEFASLYGGDPQYLSETLLFARFLRGRQQSGAIANPYLTEIVEYEAAAAELRFAPCDNSVCRLVRFTHDPARLLDALSHQIPIPIDLQCGEYRVMLDGVNDSLHVRIRRVN
jgi:hypothetical protein